MNRSTHLFTTANQQVLTATGPIEPLQIPATLRYELPPSSRNRIVVATGQQAERGQTLVAAKDGGAASLHAGSSGIIAAVTDSPARLCIEIETDGRDTSCTASALGDSFRELPSAELRRFFHHNGLVGLGGGCFPVANKLAALGCDRARVLLINAVECDPAVSCDQALILERAQAVIRGVEIAAHACKAQKVVIAIKAGANAVRRQLQQALSTWTGPNATLTEVSASYSSGYERHLFSVATGDKIPVAKHPTQFGLISFNAATCVAIARLIDDAEPLYSRICTVHEPALAIARNANLRFGTAYRDLLSQSGATLRGAARSGVIRETRSLDFDSTVTPASNCVILNPGNTVTAPCIRCGLCADACPESLQPQQLLRYARPLQKQHLDRHQLDRCIECGCCDIACPSHIALTRLFQQTKKNLDQQAEQSRLAGNAKARYEIRQLRLERQREENRQMLERKQAEIARRESRDTAVDPRKLLLESALRRRGKKRSTNRPDKNS